MGEVLDEISNLPDRFRLSEFDVSRPAEDRMILEDAMIGLNFGLGGVFRREGNLPNRERKARHHLRVANHYHENIYMLLAFVLEDVREYALDEGKCWPKRDRVSLDFEKLLTDVRAMLDSVYQLALLDQSDGDRIRGKRSDSFGKLSDWYEKEMPGGFAPPLAHLVEAMPWAQDVRKLRDGYVHQGHKAFVFYGGPQLYIEPWFHLREPQARVLPDCFYAKDELNNLIILDKLFAYIAAPVLAVRWAIGGTLHAAMEPLPHWPAERESLPYREGPAIFRLYELLDKNRDVLDASVFGRGYFRKRDLSQQGDN